MTKVFIDGSQGTTGLKIESRLRSRDDIELLKIDKSMRKNIDAREQMINSADVAILCLPDAASREAVSLITSDRVKIIDTSTAHRK